MLYNNDNPSCDDLAVSDRPERHFTRKVSARLDTAAIALSGICLVHCLALPLVVTLLPLFGATLIDHETFHQLILVLVLPTSVIALGMGYKRHRNNRIAALGVIGAGALVAAAFALHALHAEPLERWVTVAGGITLAIAHIGNFRLCRHAHGPRSVAAPAANRGPNMP